MDLKCDFSDFEIQWGSPWTGIWSATGPVYTDSIDKEPFHTFHGLKALQAL